MPRLFVAIDLPEPLKIALSGICHGIPGVRWLPPAQLHLTLSFIGEVEDCMFQAIRSTLSGSGLPPASCRLRGIGCFPAKGRPRVIWAGVDDDGAGLTAMHAQVEQDLRRLGISPEERPFTPHITLARLKEPPRESVAAFLTRNAEFQGGPFAVSAFHLYSSHLTPQGAVHTLEHTYRCATGASQGIRCQTP